jgi:PAS domain S-box-containing protein
VLTLPPGARELQINYTAFNYTKPEQIRFRYRLLGGGEQWVEGMATRSVRFFQLRPGDYTFQVSAANQDGRWQEPGASLAFTVQPFYWQTGWFRVVVALLLIGSSGGAVWRLVRARLQRSEFRKAILDSVGANIAVLDAHGIIVAVNERWKQFSMENPIPAGEPPRNLGIGANYLEVCRQGAGASAESAKAAHDGIQAVLTGRMKNFYLEYSCDSPQQKRWFSMNVTPLGSAGQSVVVAHVDISERKRTEETNRNAHELMTAIFNTVPGLLYLYNEDGRLIRWNRQHEVMTGYTAEELLNFHIEDWFDQENRLKLAQELPKIFSEGYTQVEMSLILKNKQKMSIFATGSKLILDGKPHMVGIAVDITARKQAEAELRLSEARFHAVVEQASDGFELLDLDGRYLEVNAATLRQLGYSREEILRLTVFDVDSSLNRDRFIKESLAITDAKPLHLETVHRRKDGSTFPVDVSVSTIQLGDRRCVFALVRDISERKQAEAETQRQSAELAHVARVSTMGELAASVAHELNQPLGAILANAEAADLFLNQNPPALGELRDILTDIRKDDERASEVIRRMRALLRKHELDRQPLGINSLVEDVLQVVSGDAALRKMAMSADLAPGLPKILGDRVHLQQVLLNLLLNAMDAMAGEPRERRRLSLRTRLSTDGLVEITVMDSGHGIAPDKLPRLFEPFYTTKPNGMGMGLSISRTIIAAHHGKILAENNAAGGATFRVTLPAIGKASQQ